MKQHLFTFLMTLTLWSASAIALSSERLPYPGCYDYHGCGVDDMSEWEYMRVWQSYGYAVPPDDYAHLGDGNVAVRYGNTVYIQTPQGTSVTSGTIRATPLKLIIGALASFLVLWYDQEGCMGWPTMVTDRGVFGVWNYLESDGKKGYPMPGYDSRETFLARGKLSFKHWGACHNTKEYGK